MDKQNNDDFVDEEFYGETDDYRPLDFDDNSFRDGRPSPSLEDILNDVLDEQFEELEGDADPEEFLDRSVDVEAIQQAPDSSGDVGGSDVQICYKGTSS